MISYVASIAAPAAYGVAIARWLGPTDRGILVTATAAASMAGLVGTLGLATEVRRRIVIDEPIDLPHSLVTVVFGGLTVGGSVALLLSVTHHEWFSTASLLIVVLLSAVSAVMNLLRELTFGLGRIAFSNWIVALGNFAQLIPLFVLYHADVLNVTTSLAILAASVALMATAMYLRCRNTSVTRSSQDPAAGRARISRGDRVALVPLIGGLYFVAGDRFLLSLTTTADQVAFYSIGATLGLMPSLFVAAALPAIQNSATSGGGGIRARLPLAAALTTATAIALAAIAPQLIGVLYGAEFSSSARVTQLMTLGVLPFAGFSVIQAVLLGRRRYRSAAALISAVVLVSGTGIAIFGQFGASGAAIAFVASSFAGFGVGIALLTRKPTNTRRT